MCSTLVRDNDVAAGVGFDPGLVQAEVVGVGLTPHRHEEVAAGDGIGALAGHHVETVVALGELDPGGVDDHGDTLAFQDLLDSGGDVLVFAGGQPRAPLDHGDAGAESAVHLRELQCDVAAADDHEMVWHGAEFENPHVRHVVDIRQPRHFRRHRPGAHVEEEAVGLQHLPIDAEHVRGFEPRMAADERASLHAVQPRLDAMPVVEHDFVLARLHLRHVHADIAGADAVFGAAPGQMRRVRAGHQCLGRDAAGVHAGAAD
jgi:hypothetical protein